MKLSTRIDTILRWSIGILTVRPHHIATFTLRIPREEEPGITNIIRDTLVWASLITPLDVCWESTFCHRLNTLPIGRFLNVLTLFVFALSWTGNLAFSYCIYSQYFVIFFEICGKRILMSRTSVRYQMLLLCICSLALNYTYILKIVLYFQNKIDRCGIDLFSLFFLIRTMELKHARLVSFRQFMFREYYGLKIWN